MPPHVWLVRMIGRALMLGFGAAVVVVALGVMADAPGMVALGIVLGPALAGLLLRTSEAPRPRPATALAEPDDLAEPARSDAA